jgi:hypothetical protein
LLFSWQKSNKKSRLYKLACASKSKVSPRNTRHERWHKTRLLSLLCIATHMLSLIPPSKNRCRNPIRPVLLNRDFLLATPVRIVRIADFGLRISDCSKLYGFYWFFRFLAFCMIKKQQLSGAVSWAPLKISNGRIKNLGFIRLLAFLKPKVSSRNTRHDRCWMYDVWCWMLGISDWALRQWKTDYTDWTDLCWFINFLAFFLTKKQQKVKAL